MTCCKVAKGTASARPHRELGSGPTEAGEPGFHIPVPDGSQHKATLADTNPGAPGSPAMGKAPP